jgi:hypothetical protein
MFYKRSAFFLLVLLVCSPTIAAPKAAAFPEYNTKVLISKESPYSIRLLVLKHCRERMADNDAQLAIDGANRAAQQGLKIDHFVDKIDPGQLNEWMKIKAVPGDTLIIFTIGHGFGSGNLQHIGRRSDVMNAFAAAAEQNQQETLWWQLSCHACAGLPTVESLSPGQQSLFSIIASSSAQAVSPAGVEGKIMEKVLSALAASSIDTNKDNVVNADELKTFLTASRRGNLFFALNGSEKIFGELLIQLRIIDRNNPQGDYNRGYIIQPSR